MKRLLFFTLLIPSLLHAGGDNTPLGARSAGIGHASVALGGDLWSAHNNQAGLAFIREVQAGIFYENRFLVKALSMKALAVAIPVKRGTFGLDANMFGYTQYSEAKAGISYAMPFGEKFAAAVQLDYLSVRIGENYGRTSSFTGEIGFMARPVKNLWVGGHLYNPIRSKIASFNNERAPTIFRFGGNYSFSEKVFLSAELEKDVDFKASIRGGIEYHPVKEFYLRAGGGSHPGSTAFGFGIELKKFRLDLASSFHSVLGFTPHVGIQYGIAKSRELPAAR